MSGREARLAALIERGEDERGALALEAALARDEIDRRRAQWKAASLIATGIAVAGTVAYKLFFMVTSSAVLPRDVTLNRNADATSIAQKTKDLSFAECPLPMPVFASPGHRGKTRRLAES